MSSILNATTSSGLQIAPDNSGSLQLQTNNGTTALTIDTSQNVGIGTSSPSYKLDVNGNARLQGTAAGSNVKLYLDTTSGSASNYVGITNDYYTTLYCGRGSTAQLDLTNSATMLFSTNSLERMRIDSSGNVGIGTSSIAAKFVVSDGTTTTQVNPSAGIGYFGTISNHPVAFATNSTEKMRIDSSGYAQGTVNGLSAGRMLAWQYYRLNSAVVGSNATGAQSLFGVGVTLVGSTVYEFEIAFALSKSAGTTSHNITLSFGGTATLNNIGFFISGQGGAGLSNQVGTFGAGNVNGIGFANSSSIQVVTACVTAANGLPYLLKGTVSVNAGGTFIPQYTLSAAPGGAYTTQIGSYIKIAPLGASGANTNIGSWA